MSNQLINESYSIVRTPVDQTTGESFASCRYALYPGISLAQSEPELVVLLYDSLLHQYPDTGMFLYQGYGFDPLLNRKYQQRLLSKWRALGKPTVILVTPEDRRFFRGNLGEIPTVSLYELLLKNSVSGGCNRELYRLLEPEQYGFDDSLRELGEMMGVTFYEPSVQTEIKSADVSHIPFLTSSMEMRNAMKKNGFDAVHILELIYGMGKSNQHLSHSHGEGHEHNHSEAPKVRDTEMSEEELTAKAALFDDETKKKNLQDLHDTLLSFFWRE